MIKKISGLVIAFIILSCIFSACFIENEDPGDKKFSGTYNDSDGNPFTGTVDGQGVGFAGFINVTLTLENGKIVSVVIEGNADADSQGAGAISGAPKVIIDSNSVELDTISKATWTTEGIVEACKDALSKIP